MSKIKIGILGLSEGNGHPYSFSSILNGYDKHHFEKSDWKVILNYLEKRGEGDFREFDARVTHVWCQRKEIAEEIASCCFISTVVDDYHEMLGEVDAVIIARDDYENHKKMAEPFLEANIPVMIDKPLTLDYDDLKWFMKYHEKGLLFSCSGFRFCSELDEVRNHLDEFGDIKFVKASVINSWDKYGVHMLDATLGLWDEPILSIGCSTVSGIDTYTLKFESEKVVQINTLGPELLSFSYEVIGTKKSFHTDIRDNFSAFKRMLGHFVNQVKTKEAYLSSSSIENSLLTLISGQEAKRTQSIVRIKRKHDFK
ncbi:Gfo/Idh/MocA family oxidoreductase [Vibrio splendidus]|uniref:Gfo/Idh/MocA family protein n=1 Tax=Vibrio splendidus TaxID=29497 RepID=UPI000C85CA08|nr:Gfo/Idh/MocA family oxidoreductase [Vibrio splendidus]PMI78281.1 hypothetical protein BCU37_03095 [Vibrio splendidus]PMK04001.1 hypothetical protein BCU10_23325 [Vibrio splendidus]PMK60442.1 hypothetical protein BCT96_11505 [Vibrio splendidus]